MNKPNKLKKDSICWECAEQKGWKGPDHAVTVTIGTCWYCDGKNQTRNHVIPIVDFKKPGERARAWD